VRTVVLICGPPGAGKTTLAHQLAAAQGLTVYDRDDPLWAGERHFRAALALLGRNPTARAAVIRAGATRSARARAAALIGATDIKILAVSADECRRRVIARGPRAKIRTATQLAAINRWWTSFQPDGRPIPIGKTYPQGDPRLKTGKRKRLREAVRGQGLPCMAPDCKFPGIPIDYNPRRAGDPYNPLAYELDEITPRQLGGDPEDPGNVRPRHAGCNRAAGAEITNAKRRAASGSTRPATANRW
jgi:hypothetical protein